MLKFTHGVEIGAHLAYLGHYKRTGDKKILEIAQEEMNHQILIRYILKKYNTNSSKVIDSFFWFVGSIVGYLCLISPKYLLNKVAQLLEIFAVFSYDTLSKKFPEHHTLLWEMGRTEKEHIKYFKA